MNSEKIKIWLKDYRITLPIGVVIGLILGLVIGWGIWPVQWTDLAPYHMRQDLREDYLRMAIYTSTSLGNASIAEKAWIELGDTAEETMNAVNNRPLFLSEAQIGAFSQVVKSEGEVVQPEEEVVQSEAEVIKPEKEEKREGKPNWVILSILCILVLAGVAAGIYFFVLRGKAPRDDNLEELKPEATLVDTNETGKEAAADMPTNTWVRHESLTYEEETQPVAQFMTTYAFGDDLYDDSFSVDSPTGEFLGECGVGVSETVGVGEPKRVSAFEIWLFDKNDIQTVTKVIMSEHAHKDEKTRMRLESKGELVLAEPGKQFLLETATLQLEARIIDMAYGEGAAPDLSFFERLTLELLVWPK